MGQTMPMFDPFGSPDGASADISDTRNNYVQLDQRIHGGIGRSPTDSAIRVVAGGHGTGKSLFMRKMRDHAANDLSRHAARYSASSSSLTSADVVAFAQAIGDHSANTEEWKALWHCAVIRSATSHFTNSRSVLASSVSAETLFSLATRWPELMPKRESPTSVPHEAADIIRTHTSRRTDIESFIRSPVWNEIELTLDDAIRESKPLFLYVDAIDDNFKSAPSYWLRCQRGLFYAVMDLMRTGAAGRRLHVVIAVRDLVLSSVRSSEHALRYLDRSHVNILNWSIEALEEFLAQKIETLPPEFIVDPALPGAAGWLGQATMSNGRSSGIREPIERYLIRHTHLTPRGVILMGNALSMMSSVAASEGRRVDGEDIRAAVSRTARDIANAALTNVSTQILSDAMPERAARQDIAHIYLQPNDHQIDDTRNRVIQLIQAGGSERVDSDYLEIIDTMVSENYDAEIELSQIFWQNRLLGGRTGDDPWEWFSVEGTSETRIPTEFDSFVFHPILLDRIRGLAAVLPEPAYPRC